MAIKEHLKKIPGLVQFKKKIESEFHFCILYFCVKMINRRIKGKVDSNQQLNVVFVCHRPAVWESLHSVYDALKSDPHFDVKIVAIPNKKELPGLWLNHEEYESEGAEEFWKDYGCINGYDYETKEWLDLKILKPDYVFFQQPYNVTRCPAYKSGAVSRYAKICFVPYGLQIIGGNVFEEVHPSDFFNDVSFYFCPDETIYRNLKAYLTKLNNKGFTRLVTTGFPRFDQINIQTDRKEEVWKMRGSNQRFRILWTPRWCTNEGMSTFFEYKDHIVTYAETHKDVEIVFRPHPQAFQEWETTGEMPLTEQERFRWDCVKAGITIDENGEYMSTIKSADCFLTDSTSLMGEYFATKHPIVYTYRRDDFTEIGNELAKSYYYCSSWLEVKQTLDELKQGIDKMKDTRERIFLENSVLFSNNAGESIRDELWKEAITL